MTVGVIVIMILALAAVVGETQVAFDVRTHHTESLFENDPKV